MTYDGDVETVEERFFIEASRDWEQLPASEEKKRRLQQAGIPFLEPITLAEAGYLLLKHKLLEAHGIDTRGYWSKWNSLPREG